MHLLAGLEEHGEVGRVVVHPGELNHSISELGIVVLLLSQIYHHVVVPMVLV